jgi:hypothetical protein
MDCNTARLLLFIHHPGTVDSDTDELRAVEDHVSACSDCRVVATAEQAIETHIARAMRDVSVPADLRGRLSERIAEEARLRRRRFLKHYPRTAAAIAAAICLLVAGGVYMLARPRPALDLGSRLNLALDQRGSTLEMVEKWFRETHGYRTVAPPNFNFAFLDSYDLIDDASGRRIPELIFVNGTNRARVLIVTGKDFDLKSALIGPAADSGGIKLELRPHPWKPDVAYLILYNSNSLDWLVTEEPPAA